MAVVRDSNDDDLITLHIAFFLARRTSRGVSSKFGMSREGRVLSNTSHDHRRCHSDRLSALCKVTPMPLSCLSLLTSVSGRHLVNLAQWCSKHG
jgi:hypothetical protein